MSTSVVKTKAVAKVKGHGKATPKARALTHEDYVQIVKGAVGAFGKSGEAFATATEAATRLESAERNLVGWFAVAKGVDGHLTAKEFATLSGSDVNELRRLVNAADIYAAHEKKRLPLTARKAKSVANVTSGAKVKAILADVAKGSDPLETKGKARSAASVSDRPASQSTTKKTTLPVDPTLWPALVEMMGANLHKVQGKATRTRLLAAAQTLAEALEAQPEAPATVESKATRKSA